MSILFFHILQYAADHLLQNCHCEKLWRRPALEKAEAEVGLDATIEGHLPYDEDVTFPMFFRFELHNKISQLILS